jgi:hypothetical protein
MAWMPVVGRAHWPFVWRRVHFGDGVVLIHECPLNARMETGVGLTFFLFHLVDGVVCAAVPWLRRRTAGGPETTLATSGARAGRRTRAKAMTRTGTGSATRPRSTRRTRSRGAAPRLAARMSRRREQRPPGCCRTSGCAPPRLAACAAVQWGYSPGNAGPHRPCPARTRPPNLVHRMDPRRVPHAQAPPRMLRAHPGPRPGPRPPGAAPLLPALTASSRARRGCCRGGRCASCCRVVSLYRVVSCCRGGRCAS